MIRSDRAMWRALPGAGHPSGRMALFLPAALVVPLVLWVALGWPGRWPRLRYGVHTLEAGPQTLAQARALGADTVVQIFSWREIEPTKGEYHWQKPDEVVQGAGYYGLELVVRLDQHPAWAARAPLELNAPPDDPADYIRFAATVAARYRGRVAAYIIWNEPNLAQDWGGRPPDPVAYVQLLRGAYQAIKEADPRTLVVSAGLASTNDRTLKALDDRNYLTGMYEAGAAPYFDVLGAHPYGFAYPPDDAHGAHAGLNMARLADLRAIMERYGDGRKPVWATEMGWTTASTAGSAWQVVTPEQQAAYLVQAFALARRTWPWLELMAVWNLDGAGHADWGGYSLLDADGRPRPANLALQSQAQPYVLPRPADLAVAMRQVVNRWLAWHASNWVGSGGEGSYHRILAPDTIVHLGDSQYSAPWLPLYLNRNPSTVWQGVFYLPDELISLGASKNAATRLSPTTWHLRLRLMQSNVWGNQVWINDRHLADPLPEGDLTNSWVTVEIPVQADALVAGPNAIRITIGRALPLIQDRGFAWDDLQFKDMVLWHEPGPD